jgi:hypothetical protein
MRLSRKNLKNIIESILLERNMFDTGAREREVGGSSFEAAQEDARENGRAYFVNDDNEVIEFDADGDANVTNMSQKEAYENKDGTVHYEGNL